jgi:threonine dehydratase
MNKTMLKNAMKVLSPIVRKTPLNNVSNLVSDYYLYVKLENLQYTGSYKLRGAYYRMSCLNEEEKKRGVIAASAGNHAQGVAYAANKMGIKAVIVMPQFAPLSKINATKELHAEVVLYGANFDEAYQHAKELQKIHNYTFIEPFNDKRVIAGQGTVGLEIINTLPNVDVVLVPIGGGGLASGVGYAIKSVNPNCKVYGVEANGADSMKCSLERDCIVHLEQVSTIADGIAVKKPGDLTFDMCKRYLDGIVCVSDEEIEQTALILLEKAKIVTEGAGATATAAALFEKLDLRGKNVVSIISGGNVDVNFLEQVINRALILQGRKLIVNCSVFDRPGNLNKLLELIAQAGANVISINHERSGNTRICGYCDVELCLETYNKEHIKEILSLMEEKGYKPKLKCQEVLL